MKKILLTGANGFTGRALMESLAGSEWEVIPMTFPQSGITGEVPVDFNEDRLAGVLRSLPPVDAVVHLATRVGWDGSKREELFKPNVLATAQLVDWARGHGSYFVFASAALIAGENNPHITPACGLELQTANDYLYSKWLAEEIIRMSGIMHANLRISGIFGKDGPPHLGLNKAIAGALKGIAPVQYGDGKIKRNYIYVKDLCNIIRFCIDNRVSGTHLAAGTFADTLAGMLETICTVLLPGRKPEIRPADNNRSGHHQVVEPSPLLPKSRNFHDAVNDIEEKTLK
ncbi:MAG: NAD(P)-dependent oxidoreductase [bacterium]|nr:NAD(P)-dependent oxidoreductase [bacterium]